jgi:hypothetical protein
MRAAVFGAFLAMGAAQAAAAGDTVYSCAFKPGPRDYWMPATVTITDPGPGGRPKVWDEMVEKAVGRPVVAELKGNKTRRSYAWEIGPVDISSLPQGTYRMSSEIYYTLLILPDSRATLTTIIPGLFRSNLHLFGSCTVQR